VRFKCARCSQKSCAVQVCTLQSKELCGSRVHVAVKRVVRFKCARCKCARCSQNSFQVLAPGSPSSVRGSPSRQRTGRCRWHVLEGFKSSGRKMHSVASLLSASRGQREEEKEEGWGRGDRIFSSRGPTLAHMYPIVVQTFCSSPCLLPQACSAGSTTRGRHTTLISTPSTNALGSEGSIPKT
jgi:hypothetical protein